MDTSDLAKRMKDYESVPKTRLMKRCPVVVRCDGKAHHSFCRGFKRPFDEVYIKSMQETAKYLCENVQGAVLSYQQSDEITLVLVDYKELNTSPFFDYEIQKLCSIIASMATMAFNKFFSNNVQDFGYNCCYDSQNDNLGDEVVLGREEDYKRYTEVYMKSLNKAMFDTRVFNLPKNEVTNCIYWRQLDAIRNSIQMVGQANFSHRELQNKSCNDIKQMLLEKGIDWNKLPIYQQRGSCCIKESYFEPTENGEYVKFPEGCSDPYTDEEIETGTWRSRWIIDKDIPIFKGVDREYIDKLVMVGD